MLRLAVVLVLGVLAQQIFADEPEAIVGGESAGPGEFPWQVSLQLRGSHVCGGSIIAPNVILTAAHCVDGIAFAPYSNFKVVTGTIDNRAGEKHDVKSVHQHPNYVYDPSISWVNDVAIIILHRSIQYNRYQSPIGLPRSEPTPGMPCTLSGWGKTKTNGGVPQFLQKMRCVSLSRDNCQKAFGGGTPIYSSHLCTYNKVGVGACQGDSGGPLVCNGEQYGITSWVLPCAVGAPDVYTSVYHHLSFIRQNMQY